ncbi:hypothetical protein PYCCODRAFT_757826 [Trametes coccinea BRFM310]|uniref:Uncharacterized protein n=1 Tax=Trametes coccinea (strain BRFM310) TaxID=1353009 RepID=A0A1Y2J087_TRAC3|nr:hypothetical protein PYCCODRAFT_757826 [Trametes coccinea BRFM310]
MPCIDWAATRGCVGAPLSADGYHPHHKENNENQRKKRPSAHKILHIREPRRAGIPH